jgi:hypothetical protein
MKSVLLVTVTTFLNFVSGVDTNIGIYGSTVCAVSACVASSRMGVNCTMVEPQNHLFGMSTGGLSGVDLRMPLGGISLEIF